LFRRRNIVEQLAVDETRVKLENQWVYIWSAIDVDDPEYPSNPCFYNQNIL